MGFLLKGSDGRRYIATAGHCFLEGAGTRTWNLGTGIPVTGPEDTRIGESAYATLEGDDFALIRIDKGVESRPDMCVFGGPSGLNTDRSSEITTLNFYGNGTGIGNVPGINQPVLPARSVVAPDLSDPQRVVAFGPAIFGDSGSAVNSADGRAVGTLVGLDPQGLVILRLRPQIKGAQEELGIRLKLLTSNSC